VFAHHGKASLKFETPDEAQNFLDFLGSKTQLTYEHHSQQAGNYVTSQSQIIQAPVGGLNTSNLQATSQIIGDPYARSLGSQVQAGQIISSHVISERPLVIGNQPISSISGQPLVSSTILRSEPIVQNISGQPVVQTIARDVAGSQLTGSTTTAKFVSQQMTGEV